MRRARSTTFLNLADVQDRDGTGPSAPSPHDFLRAHTQVLERLVDLQKEVRELKAKMNVFEQESSRWGLRFSQRMATVSNVLLGLYIFLYRLIQYVHSRYNSLSIRTLVGRALVPKLLNQFTGSLNRLGMGATASEGNDQLMDVVYGGVLDSFIRSSLFFCSAFLMTRRDRVKRNSGLFLSMASSLYMAFSSRLFPWTTYFTLFSNLLYITARVYHFVPAISSVPGL